MAPCLEEVDAVSDAAHHDVVERALVAGWAVLVAGGRATDAVEAARSADRPASIEPPDRAGPRGQRAGPRLWTRAVSVRAWRNGR
jgi:hypothetical protein